MVDERQRQANRANAAKFTGAALQRRFEALSIHLARQPGAAIFLPKPISRPISRRIFFAMSELRSLPEWVRCLGVNPLSGGGTRDLRPSLEKSQRWDLDEIFERDAVIEWGERFRICGRARDRNPASRRGG